jgi:hypothetical protein
MFQEPFRVAGVEHVAFEPLGSALISSATPRSAARAITAGMRSRRSP